ncbi:MAG: hypothetical protein ACKKL5_01970 [Candidatus Komeilibacteria bacterium]
MFKDWWHKFNWLSGHILALLANAAIWLWLVFMIQPTGDSAPLHFNVYFGLDALGDAHRLYNQPLWGLLIVLANIFMAYLARAKQHGIKIYLGYFSLVCQFLIFYALAALIVNYY